eukprot:TRINITY_DN10494_c0_g2_i1.p1 TRINITY_DN10494_c0_g2~~TRINITY_DN10494_c0_g2_i1.p1  ORF type:complete len:3304 (+),score=501.40 TRINITY_DN10494_c0_g2_i1:117-10028(+)
MKKTIVHGTTKWKKDGPLVIYVGQRLTEDTEEEVVKSIDEVLDKIVKFEWWSIKGPGGNFSCHDVSPNKIFPLQKKLGAVFLSLLDRKHEREDVVPYVPNVALDRVLTDRTDVNHKIEISAKTIDEVAIKEINRAPKSDDLWNRFTDQYGPKCKHEKLRIPDSRLKYGAPASEIFGKEKFTISIRELQQLERSTRIATNSVLPRKFYAKLVQFTTKSNIHKRFFELRRTIPLEKIGNKELWDLKERDAFIRYFTARRDEANEKIRKLTQKKQALLQKEVLSDNDVKELSDHDFDIENSIVVYRNSEKHLFVLTDPTEQGKDASIAESFTHFISEVRLDPKSYGFTQGGEHSTLKKALTELCTDVCISQKGYFFVDGINEKPNQLTQKTKQPIVFLAAPGLDFCDEKTTQRESKKYFRYDDEIEAFRGFLPGNDLLKRIKRIYRVIFRSCLWHGVRNPSMLAMGLGIFLSRVHDDDKAAVKKAYFLAQWQLLSETDWGFYNYFINPQSMDLAIETLEAHIAETGKPPYCNIVLHGKDVKFLAVEMAKGDTFPGPAMLNASDCVSIWLGLMGYYWELGRQLHYVSEEDFCSTGTGTLGLSGVSTIFGDMSRHLPDPEDQVSKLQHLAVPRPEDESTRIINADQVLQLCIKMRDQHTPLEFRSRLSKDVSVALDRISFTSVTHLKGFLLLTAVCGALVIDYDLCTKMQRKLQQEIPPSPNTFSLTQIGSYLGRDLLSTPLHVACLHGHLELIVFLVMSGHPLDLADHEGESVFSRAADNSVKSDLLAAGCSKILRSINGKSSFHEILTMDDAQLSNTTVLPVRNTSHTHGWTWLHWAAALNRTKLFEKLLTIKTTDPNAQDCDGWGALHWIIVRENQQMLQAFMNHKSSTTAVSMDADMLRDRFTFQGRWVSKEGKFDLTIHELMFQRKGYKRYRARWKIELYEDVFVEVTSQILQSHQLHKKITVKVQTTGATYFLKYDDVGMTLLLERDDTLITFIKPQSSHVLVTPRTSKKQRPEAPNPPRTPNAAAQGSSLKSGIPRPLAYTTVLHTCFELGLDELALMIIKKNRDLLGIFGGTGQVQPFISCLVNHRHRLHKQNDSSPYVITKLLQTGDDDIQLDTRTRCLQSVRNSLQRPLNTVTKGWLLQLIDVDESAATDVVRLFSLDDETRHLARSSILFAVHNACSCLGPSDGSDEVRARGDSLLLNKVITFISNLQDNQDIAHWLTPTDQNAVSYYLTESAPTAEDVDFAEKIMETTFWTNRSLIGNSFDRLPTLKDAYKTETKGIKKHFTILDLSTALSKTEIPFHSQDDGLTVIEHSVDLYHTYMKQHRVTDATNLAQALVLLMQLHCNGTENCLEIAINFERASVLECLLDADSFGKTFSALKSRMGKDLLVNAIRQRKWEGVAALLPQVTDNGKRTYIFDDAFPSALNKNGVKAYPTPPSLKELMLCGEHSLVRPKHYATVLSCHSLWLSSRRGNTAKEVFLTTSHLQTLKMMILPGLTYHDNFRTLMSWYSKTHVHDPETQFLRIADKANSDVDLIYDDLIDGGRYSLYPSKDPIQRKTIIIANDVHETRKIELLSRTPTPDNIKMVQRRFGLPTSAQPTFQDLNGKKVSLNYDNESIVEGSHYVMFLTGKTDFTWKSVMEEGSSHMDLVNILRYLLSTPHIDLHAFFSKPENQPCFPYFNFGYENTRLGEIFLILCHLIRSDDACDRSVMPEGFKLKGILFTPEDYSSLEYPLHTLLLKAHEGAGQKKSTKDQMRLTDLCVEVIKFINKTLLAEDSGTVSGAFRTYVESLPCSSYGGVDTIIGGGTHTDLIPIELAILLHNVPALKCMIGTDGKEGIDAVEITLQTSDDSKYDSIHATCYRDRWFPDNDEWDINLDGDIHPKYTNSNRTRRPLIHQALDLLPFPRLTRYMQQQRHLIDQFYIRNPNIVRQLAFYNRLTDEDLGSSPFGDENDLGDSSILQHVGIPWFPPGNQHLAMWSSEVTPESVEHQRREIVEVLLASVIERDVFNSAGVRILRSGVSMVQSNVDYEDQSASNSPSMSCLFDRCGIFKAVSINLRYLNVKVLQNVDSEKVTLLSEPFPPETTIRQIKSRLAETITTAHIESVVLILYLCDKKVKCNNDSAIGHLNQLTGGLRNRTVELLCETQAHAGEWRDSSKTNYCNLDPTPTSPIKCSHSGGIIKGRHWSCCGTTEFAMPCKNTKYNTDHLSTTSVQNNAATENDVSAADKRWLSLDEFGLAKLFQRAPWILDGPCASMVTNIIEKHVLKDSETLNKAVRNSFSPILIERRNQWQRWQRTSRTPSVLNTDGDSEDPAPSATKSLHITQEPPGESSLLIDTGLTILHWACLLANPDLLRVALVPLAIPLIYRQGDDSLPDLTKCLNLNCIHHAAYSAASEVIEMACQWKHFDLEGLELLNHSVPCRSTHGMYASARKMHNKKKSYRKSLKGKKMDSMYLSNLGPTVDDPEPESDDEVLCSNCLERDHLQKMEARKAQVPPLKQPDPHLERYESSFITMGHRGNSTLLPSHSHPLSRQFSSVEFDAPPTEYDIENNEPRRAKKCPSCYELREALLQHQDLIRKDHRDPSKLMEWTITMGEAANLRNCEGGGGIVWRKCISPPTGGDTPLMLAAQFCHLHIVKKMVTTFGADVSIRNAEGFDAHDVAVAIQHRYELQPQQNDLFIESDTAAARAAILHQRDSKRLLERQVELLNECPAVQKKLRRFAWRHFLCSGIHVFLFMIIVTFLAMWHTVRDDKKFYAQQALGTLFTTEEWNTATLNYPGGESQGVRMFREDLTAVLEMEDFQAWFSEPFTQKVLGEDPYDIFQLVGSVRVSKKQLESTWCKNSNEPRFGTSLNYKASVSDTECHPIYRGSGSWSLSWRPTFNSPHSRIAYYLDVADDFIDIHPSTGEHNVSQVLSEDFIDSSTRFVSVLFTFYNKNIDTFVVCQVFFEMFAQGSIQQSSKFRSVRINHYQSDEDVVVFVLEVVFTIFFLMNLVSEAIDIQVTGSTIRTQFAQSNPSSYQKLQIVGSNLYDHFFSGWNSLDLAILALQLWLFVTTMVLHPVQNELARMPDLLSTDNKRHYPQFVQIAYLVREREILLGWTVLLSWVKCLKSVVKVPRYGPIVNALINTITNQNLAIFLSVFLWVLGAFLFGLMTIYGTTVYNFRDYSPAAIAVFKMTLADTELLGPLEEEDVLWGPVLFTIIIVFCYFVLTNLIVAVLQEVYVGAINNAERSWSWDIISLYRYTVTSITNPNSFLQVLLQQLRKRGVLSLRERELKLPNVTGSKITPNWVIVPQIEVMNEEIE